MRIELRSQRPGGERRTNWRGENFNDANAARIGEQYFHFALACWKRSLRGVALGWVQASVCSRASTMARALSPGDKQFGARRPDNDYRAITGCSR